MSTSNWSLRDARTADVPRIAALLTELGHPTTPDEVAARWPAWSAAGHGALVAEIDGEVVAVLTLGMLHVLHRPRPVGRLSALVVTAAHRGRGLGRALVQAAESRLAAAGCGLVEVTSNERRADAHAFYQSLGYARTSLRFAKDVRGKV